MNNKIIDKLICNLVASDVDFKISQNKLAYDINETGSNGKTLLMIAAEEGRLPIADFLIANGALVNAAGYFGLTPLHEAAANGNLDIVNLLISKGANINSVTFQGITPLMCAAAWGHLAVVKKLLDFGADVEKLDQMGFNAIDIAREKKEEYIASLLDNFRKN